jgi:hypothetical protein
VYKYKAYSIKYPGTKIKQFKSTKDSLEVVRSNDPRRGTFQVLYVTLPRSDMASIRRALDYWRVVGW